MEELLDLTKLAHLIVQRFGLYGKAEARAPREDAVKRVISVCYAASLLREEQRQTRLAVVFSDQDLAEKHGARSHGWRITRFASALPLEPDELRKLSAAFDSARAGVLVDHEMQIWGLVRFAHDNESGSEPIHLWRHASPLALRVVIVGPGALRIDDFGTVLGEFSGSDFPPPSHALHSGPLSDRITEMGDEAEQACGQAKSKFTWAEVYSDAIEQVLRAMQRHGRGGTLLFSKSAESLEHGITFVRNDLREAAFRYTDAVETKCESQYRRYFALIEEAALVGQLTGADGAVLMRPDLVVLGCKLKVAGVDNVTVFDGDAVPGSAGPVVHRKSRGMRFMSAAQFVARDNQSLAFIASADGPLSGFMNIAGRVFVWEPLSLNPAEGSEA